jgi:hypothetical protein
VVSEQHTAFIFTEDGRSRFLRNVGTESIVTYLWMTYKMGFGLDLLTPTFTLSRKHHKLQRYR